MMLFLQNLAFYGAVLVSIVMSIPVVIYYWLTEGQHTNEKRNVND